MNGKAMIFKVFLLFICAFGPNGFAFGKEAGEITVPQGLAQKAWTAYTEGRINEANTLAEQSIDEDPEATIAYAVRALYLLKKRDYNEASNFLSRAESISGDQYQKEVNQSTAEGKKTSRTQYRIMYSWAHYSHWTIDPPHLSSFWGDEQKTTVRNWLRELPPPVTAFDHFVKGLSTIMLGRNAEADFLKAVQLNPRFAVAYHHLAKSSAIAKNYNQAAVYARKAIEINPNYSDGYNELGNAFADLGNSDAAIESYTKAIQLDPESPNAYYNRALTYYYGKKQFDLALADNNKAIELHPGFSLAYNNRGLIYYYHKKQNDLALADFRKAVDLNERNDHANYNLGVFFNETGKTYDDFASAVRYLERAVKTMPTAATYLQLGFAYNRFEKFDQSLPMLNKVIELQPNNSFAYFYRGFANRALGNFRAAIDDYSRSIQMNPKNVNAFYNRGMSYFEDVQNFDLAIADFSKVIESNPQDWDAYFYRANIYESMGNQSAADADRKKLKDLKDIALKDPKRILRTLYPNAVFDPVTARSLLSEGTSTITGQACAYSGSKFNARGAKIFLYPVTPYFEAWYNLREKQEDKITAVYLSREAARYRLETQANEEGRFVFKNLKPGKYFVQTIFAFSYRKTERIHSGSETTYNGPVMTTTNYYYDQDYIVDNKSRLEKFVEITRDGEVVSTDVAKGGGILRRGC